MTTERPILFSDAMVRAILSGAKTQTRRPVKRQPDSILREDVLVLAGIVDDVWVTRFDGGLGVDKGIITCPYGVPGDRLWVRECFAPFADPSVLGSENGPTRGDKICDYRADHSAGYGVDEDGEPIRGPRWTPSILMPRWASRLTLRVTAVRVERVQNITERDATADLGASPITRDCKTPKFMRLWDETYRKKPKFMWSANPWVWVVTFEKEGS